MSEELGQEIRELWRRPSTRQAGERFNLGSPQQLGVVLFEHLGLPVLKRTQKTKSYSTGAETLEELARPPASPLPRACCAGAQLTKLKSTYVDALPALVAPDGRLPHPLQSGGGGHGPALFANPNLQNIPVRTELGQRIRKSLSSRRRADVLLVRTTARIDVAAS